MSLRQLLEQMEQKIDQRVDMGERFSRARSSYLNSLIQLPTLRARTELMLMDITLEGGEYRELFILPLLELIDAVKQYLLFPSEAALLSRQIVQLQQLVRSYPHDRHLARIGNVLVHLQIIVLFTAEAEEWLRKAVDSQQETGLLGYRGRYNHYYRQAQERSERRGRWVELFAVLLFIAVLVALERLYRARSELRSWNVTLQQQVRQRTRELELARQESYRVVEYAADPLLVLDTQRRVVRYNQAAARLIGGDTESLLQRPVETLFATARASSDEEEQWLLTADQHQVPVLLSTSRLMGDGGEALGDRLWWRVTAPGAARASSLPCRLRGRVDSVAASGTADHTESAQSWSPGCSLEWG